MEAVRPDVVFRVSCHGLLPPEANLDAVEVQIQRVHGNQTQERQQGGDDPVPGTDAIHHDLHGFAVVNQMLFQLLLVGAERIIFSAENLLRHGELVGDAKNSSSETPKNLQIGPAVLIDGALEEIEKKLRTVCNGIPVLSEICG